MKRLRSATKRAADPMLAVLDRRLAELAVRLERHTSRLAAEQRDEMARLDERLRIGLRVVDEQLLAVARASDAPMATVAVLDGETVLIAPPGASLEPIPVGYRLTAVRTVTVDEANGWAVVEAPPSIATLRIARIERER